MTLGVDASFTHQDAARLAADGVKAVGRYAPPADPGKCITAAELAALQAHGIAVWLVHERAASQWRGGYPAGRQHGAETRQACRQIGWPDSRPIYAPYDENVQSGDTPAFVAYQRGFNDGQAVTAGGAAYGDGYVLETLTAQGLIMFKWLSDSTAFADSASYAMSGHASIIQFYGRTLPGLSGIDVDDILVADFGQHPAPLPIRSIPEMFVYNNSHGTGYLVTDKGKTPIGDGTEYQALVKAGVADAGRRTDTFDAGLPLAAAT